MTTKGKTEMFDRYRRIQRELHEEKIEGDEGGFTLIELLIVIVVLGILAAVTVFGLSNVTGQSLTSACHADAKSVAVAVEAYRAQNPNTYPADLYTLAGQDPNPPHASLPNATRYLRSLPGNVNKYNVVLGPATGPPTDGTVLIQSKATGVAFPWPAATATNAINFENPGAAGDPCANL